MAKKQAPAQRTAKPAAPVKATQRPRPKVKPQVRTQPGARQATAADIPGTNEHTQREMRRQSRQLEDRAPRARGIRVRALQPGYYGHSRRRDGDVFTIRSEAEFSKRWMERVDPTTPTSITTPNQVIKQKHDETLALKYGGRVRGGSPDDPAQGEGEDFSDQDPDDDNPLGAD
jgi:hypothetical protein